jgi:multiple sugar transport system substrate-binding protein
MGVPRRGKNKIGGVEYIKYFFGSEPGAKLQRDYMGNFSPYKPLYQQANFYSAKDDYFAGQDVQQAIAQRVLPNIKGVRPPSVYDQDLADVLNLAITTINASNGTSVTAAALINQMKDDLINKQPAITR